ncbi:MAG: hypothetical protein H6674_01295 [Dehalococcoidia bacterium]|nr:hypothetical protein [Dehalococcoidia bacterium]
MGTGRSSGRSRSASTPRRRSKSQARLAGGAPAGRRQHRGVHAVGWHRGREARNALQRRRTSSSTRSADFALIRAQKADYGNLVFRGEDVQRDDGGARRVTIAEVDGISPARRPRPGRSTPGVYVQRVVVQPSTPPASWQEPADAASADRPGAAPRTVMAMVVGASSSTAPSLNGDRHPDALRRRDPRGHGGAPPPNTASGSGREFGR